MCVFCVVEVAVATKLYMYEWRKLKRASSGWEVEVKHTGLALQSPQTQAQLQSCLWLIIGKKNTLFMIEIYYCAVFKR